MYFAFCILLLSTLFTVLLSPKLSPAADRDAVYREARYRMVKEYIEREGVKDPRVLDSMRSVPRHEFVLPSMRS